MTHYFRTPDTYNDFDLFIFDDCYIDRVPTLEEWKEFFSNIKMNPNWVNALELKEISYKEFRKLHREAVLDFLNDDELDEEEFYEWLVSPFVRRDTKTDNIVIQNPFVYEMPADYLEY